MRYKAALILSLGLTVLAQDPWQGYLGSPCLPGTPACVSENSICQNSQCQCKPNFKASNGDCIPVNSGCPNGRNAYLLKDSQIPLKCNSYPDNCPLGYACNRNLISAGYICCAENEEHCPPGSLPYIDPLTGSARHCLPGQACPATYTCTAFNGRTTCCSASVQQRTLCERPAEPLFDPQDTSQPLLCDNGFCPLGSECQRTFGINVCCQNTVPNLSGCPTGLIPYITSGTKTALACNISDPLCPQGYNCYFAVTQYLCCGSGLSTSSAPSNGGITAENDAVNECGGRPTLIGIQCSTDQDCPLRYYCEPTRRRCCRGTIQLAAPTTVITPVQPTVSVSPNARCPNGTVTFLDHNSPRACRSDANCPRSFFCESQTQICCSVSQRVTLKDACPQDMSPVVSSNEITGCVTNNDCPAAAACILWNGKLSCCIAQVVYCPDGDLPLRDARNQTLYCSDRFRCPLDHFCISDVCCSAGATTTATIVTTPVTLPTARVTTPATTGTQSTISAGTVATRVITTTARSGRSTVRIITGGICPAGTTPFIDPLQALPIACQSRIECPMDYACVNGLCCINSTDQFCDYGSTPLMVGNLLVVTCNITMRNVCPPPYDCRSSARLNTNICCAQVDTQLVDTTITPPTRAPGFAPTASRVTSPLTTIRPSAATSPSTASTSTSSTASTTTTASLPPRTTTVRTQVGLQLCRPGSQPLLRPDGLPQICMQNSSDRRFTCPQIFECYERSPGVGGICCEIVNQSTLPPFDEGLNRTVSSSLTQPFLNIFSGLGPLGEHYKELWTAILTNRTAKNGE